MNARRPAALLHLACALGLGVTAGRTARADESMVVTRAQAVTIGAERGPSVREAAAPLAAAEDLSDAARSFLPYSPRINAFAGRRTGAFGSGLEVGGGVVQELSFHGLGARRDDVAAAVARATRDEVARARLEGAALAALAWVDLLEAQELVRVRASSLRDATEIARVAGARTERGVALPAEASLAAAEVGAAELGERDAEGRLFEARSALQFALGMPTTTSLAVYGELRVAAVAPAGPPVREHPVELAARSQIDLARADAELARAQASPSFGLGVNVAREGQGEQLVTGTITVPIPIFDPSRFDAARHRTNVASATGRAARIHDEQVRDAAIATHERLHTREVHETLENRLLAPLRESVRLARASYQAGTQDVTTFLLLRQRLVMAEEQLAHAAGDVQRADVRYELVQGTLLARGNP